MTLVHVAAWIEEQQVAGSEACDTVQAMGEAEIDERLWVTFDKTGERGYIVGSCHTFPGRFAVWVPTDGRSRCAAKSEIADASPEASYWIAGFLNGSVPAPPENVGDESVWMSHRAAFLMSGEWPRQRA